MQDFKKQAKELNAKGEGDYLAILLQK